MDKLNHNINKINNLNSLAKTYDALISLFEYQKSSMFVANTHNSEIYDDEYHIKFEGSIHTIVGTKKWKVLAKQMSLKHILRYETKMMFHVPFFIFILENEVRIYNNSTIRGNKFIFSSKQKTSIVSMELFHNDNIINELVAEELYSLTKNMSELI